MIEVDGVTKRYGRFTALERVSLDAPDGCIYGLVGYNGAGKTTLLKTVAGVYLCDEGAVLMDGVSVHEHRSPERAPFIVADEPYFLLQATPDVMGAFYRGYYPRWSDATFRKLLDLFELDRKGRVGGFSKGMQRQVVLLLALATGSRCLLLDESFDGLDLGKRNLFKALLRRYARRREAVVMLSSHNLRELEGVVDRIAMIDGRRLTFDATVDELHERYRTCRLGDGARAAAALAGSPAVRWIRVEDGRCTFVADTADDDVARRLTAAGLPRPEVVPATLEEIFLSQREVSGGELDGVFE